MAAWGKGFRKTVKANLGFRGGTVSIVHSYCAPALIYKLACSPQHIHFAVQNLAAWGVAGVVAYYLWVKPEREAELERKVCKIMNLDKAWFSTGTHISRLFALIQEANATLLRAAPCQV